jgi:hypothetical protein
VLAPGADRAPYEAALELFLPRTLDCFYPNDVEVDPRRRWSRDGLVVSGALNVYILRVLAPLIRQIDDIHRRAGGAERVVLRRTSGTFSVTRLSRMSA